LLAINRKKKRKTKKKRNKNIISPKLCHQNIKILI